MASCNHNTCPPTACVLTNAIKDYKKARSSVNDASLKPFLRIIEALQAEINCKGTGGNTYSTGQEFPCDSPSTVWMFNHNLGTKLALIQVYDENFNQLIPETIELVTDILLKLHFPHLHVVML